MNVASVGDNTKAVGKPDARLLLRLTDYWRRIQVATALESLKDERDGSGDEERKQNIIRAPFSQVEFAKGICPQSVWGRAFKKLDDQRQEAHLKALLRNSRAVMPEPAHNISAVFSPYGLKSEGERDPVYVVFGIASVDRLGFMTTANVDSDLPPIWIGRSCLHPTDGLEDDVFPLADADAYYNEIAAELKERQTWPTEWSLLLRACDKIWEKAGTKAHPLLETLARHYKITPGWIRFEEKDSKKLTIVRMYEKLHERVMQGDVEALYREVAFGQHRQVFSKPLNHLHLGQMSADFPLAPSQRSSLLAYLQTPIGHITAVNGPPGTGKTTLLQSVVATDMVSHAIAQSDAPLYIAGAATNQAVSNIIKAFREATESLQHPMADRWLPGLGRRYGLYFRGSKGDSLELAKGSLVCIPSNFGRHENYNDDDIKRTIEEVEAKNNDGEEVAIDLFLSIGESKIAREYFIAQASRLLNTRFGSLESAKSHLHIRLKATTARIIAYSRAADNLIGFVQHINIGDCKTYDSALEMLKERQRLVGEKLQILASRHLSEKSSEMICERDENLKEVDESAKLLKNLEVAEQQEAAKEDKARNVLLSQWKVLNEAEVRYVGLGEPTTFWSWIGERYFPWTKNEKRARLKAVTDWLDESNLGAPDAYDILTMRQHVEKILCMGRALVEKIRRIDEAGLNRKDASQKKISAFNAAIALRRRERREAFNQRDTARSNELEAMRLALESDLILYDGVRKRFEAFDRKCLEAIGENAPREFDKIISKIDTTLRVEAFLLATHYWECRFLLEVEQSGWRSQAKRREAFKAISMLTPCFVSTFDKMGTAFNVMKQDVLHPMWGLADTLIVDEAGQASPDKGAFAFSLAKKAIVVGDVLQLPPVNSTDSGTILTSIARTVGILDNKFVTSRGLLTGKVGIQQANGSLMRMASAAAYYDMSPTTQGMWLRDHFRCDPRIIAFCNRIWYTGETSLIPRRVRDKESFVPHFGHVNVVGKANNKSNEAEAAAIITWLNHHGENLQRHYGGKPLHQIVAVLTPFSNQRKLLRRLRDKFTWSSAYGEPEKIVMGTVHALQGAEREVVIFSTVYDRVQPSYFFDREHTLLNVAVSRAKDSFIVFGNRTIFAKGQLDTVRPSTLLGEHLMDERLLVVPSLPAEKPRAETA